MALCLVGPRFIAGEKRQQNSVWASPVYRACAAGFNRRGEDVARPLAKAGNEKPRERGCGSILLRFRAPAINGGPKKRKGHEWPSERHIRRFYVDPSDL